MIRPLFRSRRPVDRLRWAGAPAQRRDPGKNDGREPQTSGNAAPPGLWGMRGYAWEEGRMVVLPVWASLRQMFHHRRLGRHDARSCQTMGGGPQLVVGLALPAVCPVEYRLTEGDPYGDEHGRP